jgi:hypothetical protein
MHLRNTSCVARGALLLTLFANVGEAQEIAASFGQLRVLVKPGDKVSVTDRAGREVQGAVAELSSSSLALVVEGNRRSFLEGDIDAISQRRPDSLANGAKWGFAVGAGLGFLAGLALATEYDGGGGALIPMLALAYGGMGAGAGVGIDALMSSNRVIYARGGSASKVTFHPILTPRRRGVLASIAF